MWDNRIGEYYFEWIMCLLYWPILKYAVFLKLVAFRLKAEALEATVKWFCAISLWDFLTFAYGNLPLIAWKQHNDILSVLVVWVRKNSERKLCEPYHLKIQFTNTDSRADIQASTNLRGDLCK